MMGEKPFFKTDNVRMELIKRFPMGYVPRSKIEDATGGILHPKTMANRDTDKTKKSIVGSVKIGGKVCYPIEEIINFIKSETKIFDGVS